MNMGKPAEGKWELRVLNFSAKFLSARRRSPTCSAAPVEDGDGSLVPTHLGKAQTSLVACGRPTWRPHSEALNKHEMLPGAAAVAEAVTLLRSGTSTAGKSRFGART